MLPVFDTCEFGVLYGWLWCAFECDKGRMWWAEDAKALDSAVADTSADDGEGIILS